jgi:hydroxymethylpyrimidine/phosphomethylpyrimidine kinase
MRIALSVAGSDPTGGAGIQMDLQVFRAFGVHGAAAITALTSQDTARVHQVLPTFPSVILDQLRKLLGDLRPDAVKLGMLASDDVLRNVDLALDSLGAEPPPLVIDPVLLASDGTPLLERRAWSGIGRLCERATLVTPNRPEAFELTGVDADSRAGAERAARFFVEEFGAKAALVKGGHASEGADDCLAIKRSDGIDLTWLSGERIPGEPVHGTGCALSAAITARLAHGDEIADAVGKGRAYVRAAIERAVAVGAGARILGIPPMGDA